MNATRGREERSEARGKCVVAYDVATSYSDSKLEYRIVDDDSAISRIFATCERAWFGEVIDGEAGAPACEPGYALVIDHGDRGRPEERPRPAQITIREYFEAATLLGQARDHANAIAMRVLRRKPDAEPAWPPEARVLRAETLAHPDDDDPRLVFADAIAGKRGSLVIVQCDLARGDLAPAESRARRRAQRDLLAKHGAAWSRLGGLATRCIFRRGFVEVARISRDVLVNDYARTFDATPHLVSIAIDASPSMYMRQFAQAGTRDGWWQRLRGISIDSGMLASNFDGMLGNLRAFEMSRAAPQHAYTLIETGGLRDLESLCLPSHQLGVDTLDAIIRTSPNLRVLDVSSASHRSPLPIPASVRELYASGLVTALPRQLEKLAIFGLFEARTLGGLASLRSLDLSAAFTNDPLEELELPRLRELRLNVSPAKVIAIAKAFGAQLELLDLRGIAGVESIHDELRELVAGDVWMGKPDFSRPLMPSSYLPDEPMWDVGAVDLS